jgi:TM2 domain-containing membrane protein YozV
VSLFVCVLCVYLPCKANGFHVAVAPAAMLYYLIVQPILRWLLIFVYRPKYDGGGDKWPQLHQIIISALMLGQVLMAVTLSLKAAYWEGIFVGCCAIPTYFFHLFTLERFYRPYHDAALLQTSRLDSWQESHSLKKREEYRRWLVDCHKASYVPICMLGSKENLLTAEPAVAVPRESDEDYVDTTDERRGFMRKQSAQRGAIFNRKFK